MGSSVYWSHTGHDVRKCLTGNIFRPPNDNNNNKYNSFFINEMPPIMDRL